MIDAGLLLPKLFERAGDNRELMEALATVAWKRAAGEGLANHALALRLNEKTLVVAVADAVWQKQLQAMSAELIFRMNKWLQRSVVNAIDFRINPAALGPAMRSQRRSESVAPLPGNIVSSASQIEDDDLRQQFIRAASNCIERRDAVAGNQSTIRNPKSEI